MYYLHRGRSHVSIGYVPPTRKQPTRRGDVSSFSSKSRIRLRRFLADSRAEFRFMGTLTYGGNYPADGAVCKQHLDEFLQWMLRRMRKLSWDPFSSSVCWFLEFQERGAPHFHLFYTDRIPWREAAEKWAEILDDPQLAQTATKFEVLRKGRPGTMAYAAKYAAKQAQKQVPEGYENVGRFWGVRGLRDVVSATTKWVATEPGKNLALQIFQLLGPDAKKGFLRRIDWEQGEGATFVPPEGEALMPIGTSAKIEILISKAMSTDLTMLHIGDDPCPVDEMAHELPAVNRSYLYDEDLDMELQEDFPVAIRA